MLKITKLYDKIFIVKRIFIALICLVIFSTPILFVGCGNNNTPNTNTPPPTYEEQPEEDTETEIETPTIPETPTPDNPTPDNSENSEPENPITSPENTDPENSENNTETTPPNDDTDNEDNTPSNPTLPDDNNTNDNINNDTNDNTNNDTEIGDDSNIDNDNNINNDNSEPINPSNPEPEPEPEPEPVIKFDFTIYNAKPNVIYDLENNKIYVELVENLSNNIVHFKCSIYIDEVLSTNQTITYTLTNEDKLANSSPQNLSNFYFKFKEKGTYTLTLYNSDKTFERTIDIVVE